MRPLYIIRRGGLRPSQLSRLPATRSLDWCPVQEVCENLETVAYSVSDDGKVTTGPVIDPLIKGDYPLQHPLT